MLVTTVMYLDALTTKRKRKEKKHMLLSLSPSHILLLFLIHWHLQPMRHVLAFLGLGESRPNPPRSYDVKFVLRLHRYMI